jgi:hypothetical protein
MSDTKKVEDALFELEQQATNDAGQFFIPPVTADKLRVIKKEVNGPFAFITVQSHKGTKVILRYAWRTKQLLGTA